MEYTPVAVSDDELKAISEIAELQEQCGHETASELLEDIQNRYIAKFEHYITDGPGYSGPLYLIVWGVLIVTIVGRDMTTGQLRLLEQD